MNDPRLARNVNHDPRSKTFAYDVSGLTFVSAQHPRHIPVFDQGNLGSCTGNAGMGNLGTGWFYGGLPQVKDWTETGAISLYSAATKIDPYTGTYPPTDTGSDGLSIAKVLKTRGWINGYTHTFTFDDALKALGVQPVITGINWYESFYNPDNAGIVKIDVGSKVAGGHEFVLDGIDTSKELIYATNSWGTSWSLNGRFSFSFADFQRLLNEDGDCTVFTALTQVDSADLTLWGNIKAWAYAPHSLASNKRAAAAIKVWATSKGLV